MKQWILIDEEDPSFREDVTAEVEAAKSFIDWCRENPQITTAFIATVVVLQAMQSYFGKGKTVKEVQLHGSL